MKVAIIVGHTKNAMGAQMAAPYAVSEYQYNIDIAQIAYQEARYRNLECKVIFRDSIGIRGAYLLANTWIGTDNGCAIELHFNSEASGKAQGTETLFDLDPAGSRDLAETVQVYVCEVFMREGKGNRGAKLVTAVDRGGENMILAKVPSVVVEPFFGSSTQDAKLGMTLKSQYAIGLVDAVEAFLNKT